MKITQHPLIALDMDGTITQHRSALEEKNRQALDQLRTRFPIVMVGAGSCQRIHQQLEGYPIDVVGCYGMEYARYDQEQKKLITIAAECAPVKDREQELRKADAIRKKYGYTEYLGESLEFHASGMITFALLGTKANIADKLAFDPDRSKRRLFYHEVCQAFSDYTVFVGGSSSFDIVPHPYNKLYALDRYCALFGYSREDIIYFGDDWEPGGNDHQVYEAGIQFIQVKNYLDFAELALPLMD